MPYTVHVVARPEMAAGFALASVPVHEVRTLEEGAAVIADLAQQPGLGVLLAEEALIDAVPDAVRRELLRRPTPVIVPVPRPTWAEPMGRGQSYILGLLQRAVGYRMRLR